MVMTVLVVMFVIVVVFMRMLMFMIVVMVMFMSVAVFEFLARRIVMPVLMCMGMALVSMLVKVFILFDAHGNNACMSAFYAALDALFEVISDIRDSQGIELFLTGFDVSRKFGQ